MEKQQILRRQSHRERLWRINLLSHSQPSMSAKSLKDCHIENNLRRLKATLLKTKNLSITEWMLTWTRMQRKFNKRDFWKWGSTAQTSSSLTQMIQAFIIKPLLSKIERWVMLQITRSFLPTKKTPRRRDKKKSFVLIPKTASTSLSGTIVTFTISLTTARV